MDKYNLLDADDFFSQINSEKKDEQEKEQSTPKEEQTSTEEHTAPPKEPEIIDEPDDLIINMDDEVEKDNFEVINESSIKVDSPKTDIPEDISVEILEDEPEIINSNPFRGNSKVSS